MGEAWEVERPADNCAGGSQSLINEQNSGPHLHHLLPSPCFAPASGLKFQLVPYTE